MGPGSGRANSDQGHAGMLQWMRSISHTFMYHASHVDSGPCINLAVGRNKGFLTPFSMMWYEFFPAMYICGFLKLFNYVNSIGIIFNICFAVHLIHADQFIFL